MSDLEPFDDELAAELRRRASGGGGSTAAAHDAVVQRAGAVRRRRAAIGGAGAMAMLLIGGIAVLPRGAEEVGPAVTGDVLPTFADDATTVRPPRPTGQAVGTTDVPPTNEQSVQAGAPGSTASIPVASIPVASIPVASIPTSVVVTPSSSVPRAGSSSVAAGSTATAPPSTGAPGTPVTSAQVATSDSLPGLAPFTETYRSPGGSITVTWSGTAFVLQAVSPEVGFLAEVEDATATRVRVRFESLDADSRIEVRVADGRLVVDID